MRAGRHRDRVGRGAAPRAPVTSRVTPLISITLQYASCLDALSNFITNCVRGERRGVDEAPMGWSAGAMLGGWGALWADEVLHMQARLRGVAPQRSRRDPTRGPSAAPLPRTLAVPLLPARSCVSAADTCTPSRCSEPALSCAAAGKGGGGRHAGSSCEASAATRVGRRAPGSGQQPRALGNMPAAAPCSDGLRRGVGRAP